jgi:hypothetical protein
MRVRGTLHKTNIHNVGRATPKRMVLRPMRRVDELPPACLAARQEEQTPRHREVDVPASRLRLALHFLARHAKTLREQTLVMT